MYVIIFFLFIFVSRPRIIISSLSLYNNGSFAYSPSVLRVAVYCSVLYRYVPLFASSPWLAGGVVIGVAASLVCLPFRSLTVPLFNDRPSTR